MKLKSLHSFHIPVMGLAYTIDSPIRVAQYGITSTISVMDDELLERLNKFYCEKFELPYQEITKKIEDFRAKRITAYLNTLDTIVKHKFENFKHKLAESKNEIEYFIDLLPNISEVKTNLQKHLDDNKTISSLKSFLDDHLTAGEIDVNIMTKVDRENYNKNELLPSEFNDAHAALRGFANSTLQSSVVLSAGMNPKLFSYFESFDSFYPKQNGYLEKRIILKVSDFRSALIQGNILAKKGLWVSEYRIESGLNCGGHAFATEGYLLGVILEEFKQRKEELITSTHQILVKALEQKNKPIPNQALELKITAQGGVGTAAEHQFLLDYYNIDTVGWGSPFLLVPEATSVDVQTRQLLAQAKETDLFISEVSPLGVPFNTIKGATNDYYKQERIDKNKAGSSCPRKYLALNKAYDKEGLCTASRKYQSIEIAALEANKSAFSNEEYTEKFNAITEKACLCIGLANASLLENDLPIKGEKQGVVICPGPNIAYFTKEVSLQDMTQHIYGNQNIITNTKRPHFFIKELKMYIDHFNKEKKALENNPSAIKTKKVRAIKQNLHEGIAYYKHLFNEKAQFYFNDYKKVLSELNRIEEELFSIEL